MNTPSEMVADEVLAWLRQVHETTTWTTSVCSGALILGAAGILKGLPATTHWWKLGVLTIMGAKPQPEDRIVRSGKVATSAGVSAGIDLALWLAGEIAGRERAEAIQSEWRNPPRVSAIRERSLRPTPHSSFGVKKSVRVRLDDTL